MSPEWCGFPNDLRLAGVRERTSVLNGIGTLDATTITSAATRRPRPGAAAGPTPEPTHAAPQPTWRGGRVVRSNERYLTTTRMRMSDAVPADMVPNPIDLTGVRSARAADGMPRPVNAMSFWTST